MSYKHVRRALCAGTLWFAGCAQPNVGYDVIIRGGTVYDGSGAPPVVADVGIRGDRIAALGDLSGAEAAQVLDASGMAVSPGFINMLSWANESLIVDGRSLGDIRQGVTLEVLGEGTSMGPANDAMKAGFLEDFVSWLGGTEAAARALGLPPDAPLEVPWTTLGEYLDFMERKGVATNVASFIGATTVRVHEIGYDDRPPTADELVRMRALVRTAMEEGAVGVSSALIYTPGFFADTDELIALSEVAAEYDGMYISHLRSEGARLLESVEELITIAREAGIRAEIYHLKAAGRENWHKLEDVIARVEQVRAEGLGVTADMYTYTAGSTGLDAAMPPWVQEGGYDAWAERIRDPETRARVVEEMRTPTDEWENLLLASGAEGALLVGFRNEELRRYQGMTLAEVAAERGTPPEETAIDLVIEDGTRVQVVYFLMSEENVRRQIALPWVSFDSDAASMAPEGVFLQNSTHPRAYGNFARLLGRYVRQEGVIPLEEAVRKLTSLPAANLRISDRGRLAEGFFADVVIFDPATVIDHATYEDAHQLATGVSHVFVNGVMVLEDSEPTGAMPGRFVRGPGWTGG